MKRLIATIALLAALGVLTGLLPGAVTPAHATPISRAQAARAAKEYLQTQAFSLKGLAHQLKFEGFSTSNHRRGGHARDG